MVVAFKDLNTADKVLNEIIARRTVDLEGACVVFRDTLGRPHLKQMADPIPAGARDEEMRDGLRTTLARTLLASPLTGWAPVRSANLLDRALAGRRSECGIENEFVRALGEAISPNCSALFFWLASPEDEETLRFILTFGGNALRTSLSDEPVVNRQCRLSPGVVITGPIALRQDGHVLNLAPRKFPSCLGANSCPAGLAADGLYLDFRWSLQGATRGANILRWLALRNE